MNEIEALYGRSRNIRLSNSNVEENETSNIINSIVFQPSSSSCSSYSNSNKNNGNDDVDNNSHNQHYAASTTAAATRQKIASNTPKISQAHYYSLNESLQSLVTPANKPEIDGVIYNNNNNNSNINNTKPRIKRRKEWLDVPNQNENSGQMYNDQEDEVEPTWKKIKNPFKSEEQHEDSATYATKGATTATTDEDFLSMLTRDNTSTWKLILNCLADSNFFYLFQSSTVTNNSKNSDDSHDNILSKILMSRAIDSNTRLSLFRTLIRINSNLASVKHGNSLPIHHIVRNLGRIASSSKYTIIHLLIDAFPDGLMTGDIFGQTPLHVACCRGSSVKEIKLLLNANEQAATIQDNTGNLPIHIALCRRCTPDKFKVLYNAYPESLLTENNRGYNPITLASNDQTGKHSNASLIECLKKKLLSEVHNGNFDDHERERVIEGFSTNGRAGGQPPDQNDVVDLVYTSDSDNENESSASHVHTNKEEDESEPNSPEVKSETSSTMHEFLQRQEYIANSQLRPSPPLPPQQQQPQQATPSSSHQRQYMTLDHHRLAAAQAAAFPNQIAIQAGPHMLSLPRAAAAHFPQTSSLTQSASLGLTSAAGGPSATNMAGIQYQVPQQHTHHEQNVVALLKEEQKRHENELSQLNENHDALVEDIVQSCEHSLVSINESSKEELALQQLVQELKLSLLEEESLQDNDATIQSYAKNSNTLCKDITSVKGGFVKSKLEQDDSIQTLQRKHLHETQQLYTNHTEATSISNQTHNNTIQSISKSKQDVNTASSTQFNHICTMYDRDIATMHLKIGEYKELVNQQQQVIIDRKNQYANSMEELKNVRRVIEFYILKERRYLESKIDYFSSKLKKQTRLKEEEAFEDLDCLLQRQASDFNDFNNSTGTSSSHSTTNTPSDVPGNCMIVLLKADRTRLLEKIASLKQTIGEDLSLDDSQPNNTNGIDDLDMTEEVVEFYI